VGEMVRIRVEHSIARGVERSVFRRRINDLVHLLSDVLRVADYRGVSASGALRDPDDEPILATALAAEAGYIVSLNTRDFPPSGEALRVRFITPRDFLAELETKHPSGDVSRQADDAGRQLP
jgi:predicted nucleic acid-binding protein